MFIESFIERNLFNRIFIYVYLFCLDFLQQNKIINFAKAIFFEAGKGKTEPVFVHLLYETH